MRGRPGLTILTLSLFSASAAFADAISSLEAPEFARGSLKGELFSIAPSAGILRFDAGAASSSRVLGGALLNFNAALYFNRDWSGTYLGLVSGVLFSELPSLAAAGGNAELLMIPANVKLGRNFGDRWRASLHGGGNVVYRAQASSLLLAAEDSGADPLWKLYPNAGGAVEVALGKGIWLGARTDWTFGPEGTPMSSLLGIGWML